MNWMAPSIKPRTTRASSQAGGRISRPQARSRQSGQPNANQDYVGTSASPINPSLFPPADNGGPTKTCRPGIYSVAPNHGPPDCCDVAGNPVATDQRGLNRNRGGCPDIGAYEIPVGGSAPLAVLLN